MGVNNDTSGEHLSATILSRLSAYGLNSTALVGQGYDGAANTSGRIKGASTRILNQHPATLYTHCSSHKLCLVAMDGYDLKVITKMFDIISQIAAFFSGSAKRHKHFDRHAAGLSTVT